jgi:hypothetical protein
MLFYISDFPHEKCVPTLDIEYHISRSSFVLKMLINKYRMLTSKPVLSFFWEDPELPLLEFADIQIVIVPFCCHLLLSQHWGLSSGSFPYKWKPLGLTSKYTGVSLTLEKCKLVAFNLGFPILHTFCFE